MPSYVEELALRWRRNPDEQATVALCDAVRGSEHTALMLEVGNHARDKLAASVPALVAAARMFMRALRHAEAQSLLVRAGRLAPREGVIYRILGEVLLRRGDAERAEKVFERAVAFGIRDSATLLWLERARVFKPMHVNAGTRAVAVEVERTSPAARDSYLPGDAFSDVDTSLRDAPTQPRGEAPTQPHGDAPTQPRGEVPPPTTRGVAPPVPLAARSAAPRPTAPRETPPPGAGLKGDPALPLVSGFAAARDAMDATTVVPRSHGFSARGTGGPYAAKTWDRPTPMGLGPPPPAVHAHTPPLEGSVGLDLAGAVPSYRMPAAAAPSAPSVGIAPRASNAIPQFSSHAAGAAPEASPPPLHPFFVATRPVDVPKVTPNRRGAYSVEAGVGAGVNGTTRETGARVPSPKELLEALALVGVFEPQGAQATPLHWDKATPRRRWRSGIFLVFMMLAMASGAYGIFRHVEEKRRLAHGTAERMLAQIDGELHAGKAAALSDTEKTFSQVFDLESRSPRAALLWLRERALAGLLKGGRDVAFEDAIARAHEVGIPESSYAFAQVASSLFQGDTAGAASLLPRFDGPSEKDAFYQLFAGQ
ncbi:MAG TPA: hypothetical protein VNO21_20720, partial [Polyangiaceae bacterium]|nr:hypothetical protein [Polyangiaceae bacterium]